MEQEWNKMEGKKRKVTEGRERLDERAFLQKGMDDHFEGPQNGRKGHKTERERPVRVRCGVSPRLT